MIDREILQDAKYTLTQFRAVCITGPRQSGKTTSSKMLFKGKLTRPEKSLHFWLIILL